MGVHRSHLLLRTDDVNPDMSDCDGRTPLSYAAEECYVEVAEILLGGEVVNHNKEDNVGRTLLMCAAKHDHQNVITLVQLHEAVALSAVCGLDATSS